MDTFELEDHRGLDRVDVRRATAIPCGDPTSPVEASDGAREAGVSLTSGEFDDAGWPDEARPNTTVRRVGAARRLTRRHLVIALGVLWLADGLLQLQPFMFSRVFYNGILGMANMGLPGPVATADYHVATLLTAHPALWNTAFAGLQVLLGLGLLWRRTARFALICSIPWAVGVWVVGEGFGGMFMPGTSLLTGAPGAALVYALLALMLLSTDADTGQPGVLIGRAGQRIGAAGWALIWTVGALLELEGTNHAAAVPGAQIANGGYGEPGVFRLTDGGVGRLIGQQGYLFALILGLLALFVGWAIFIPRWRRRCLVTGIVLALFVGVVGQDLGAIFTGHGTDPGSGPVLVLLALALWRPRNNGSEANFAGTVHVPIREKEASQCHVGSSSLPQRQPAPA